MKMGKSRSGKNKDRNEEIVVNNNETENKWNENKNVHAQNISD